ncbi:ATP-binding protein [Streptomyces sp. NPDC051364]|uniref:ATP-binding protein n=1 Tax=Streptomyces sp. NPDC051364 TaxID=3155799 RepID=UPI003437E09E
MNRPRPSRETRFILGSTDHAVPSAGHRILTEIRSWCLPLSDEAHHDLTLMLGELIANAVEHSAAPGTVMLRWAGDRLRVEVTDPGSRLPVAQPYRPDSEHGRGLILIATLATAWGCSPTTAGKTVWFEMKLPAPNDEVDQDHP